MLSDSETDARDRLGIVGPVFNTRDELVADDFEDLFDGGNAAFVRFDESGNLWNDQLVWTGSHPDGSRYRAGGPAAYKQDWTSSTGTVAVGGTLRQDAGWLEWRQSSEHGTVAPARLYCVDSVERRVELSSFPLMAINTIADDICSLGPGGACEADGVATVRPPARLFDVFQYATGMVVDQPIADRGYPYDEVFNLGRADELVDRLELCGGDCRDAGVVVRVPHCFSGGWSVGDPDLGLGIPDCAEVLALDDAAANAYRERWWRPRFEDAVRGYGPASRRGGRVVGWSVAEERAMAATFWIDHNDWGYPLLARARTALDRQDPWSRPLLNFLPNNSAPGLSIPLQLVYGKVARCDDSVHHSDQLETDLTAYATWPLLDGYPGADLVAFDLFPGDSAEAPAGVREVAGGSHTAGYTFPTCFAVDAAGQPLALTRHVIAGNYVSSVLSAFEVDGLPYGDRNRIWGYHQSESAVEARDVTKRLFASKQWDLPANLVVHAIEMSWGCDDGLWRPRPDTEEHARHDFWVGLHLGQGVYLYNLRYRSESPVPGPGDTCAPREPLTHPAWRVSDAVFPDGAYPVGLHLLKHGSPPPAFGDVAFEPVAPMREALATWRRDPREVAVTCNFLQAEELPGSGVAAVGEVIDEGPVAEENNYGDRGYVDEYPVLHCTAWEAPDRNRLWIVATNSFAQRTRYEIVLPRPHRRLDTPANPGLSQSVSCAPEPRGEVCKVWLDGIDAHVFYVELIAG